MKRIINILVALSLFIANFSAVSASASYDPGEIYTIYENSFDDGAASVPMATEDGYAAQNEFMDFDGILGQGLQNSEVSGNMGVRISSGAWLDDRTFLFDFTKGGTKNGLASGILTVSFDFRLDGNSGANFAIMGANMSAAYEGNRMMYFHTGGKYEILNSEGDWGNSENGVSADCDKVYNIAAAINLDEGRTDYYLDDVLIKTQTNWSGVTVNNIAISLSGLLDYFDNLKVTYQGYKSVAACSYTLYENAFDNGAASVPMATEDGYAAQNEFMDFDGILGQGLQNSEVSGNMGVRISSGAWLDDRTFLFDFTKGGTKSGLDSGILSLSFDFRLDGNSGANFAIIGANMSAAYEGNRMIYFHGGGKYEILNYQGDWGGSENAETLDCDKVYNLTAVINLDKGKTDYYLDDVLVKTQTNWSGITVNNIAISLSGLLDYFDNLKLTYQANSYTVYENTFDNGAASVPMASEDGYAAQNEFMDFDGILGQPLQNSEVSGNMGVRIRSGAWLDDRTFFFDFTKGGTKEGIYSGVWTIGFDFSLDKSSTANSAIMGMNMSQAYAGSRMVYFNNNGTFEVLSSYGDWGSSNSEGWTAADYDTVYNLQAVINFDEGKTEYYLNNSLIKTQTNPDNMIMNNFALSLTGVVDYLDNLKITAEYPKAIENFVTSEKTGNIFYDYEQPVLKLKTINRHKYPVCENVNIVVTDADNNTVWSETRRVNVLNESEKEILIYPDLPLFGTYFMKVTSANSREFNTRLSRSVKADVLNEKLGVCAHFDGRYDLDIPAAFDLMSSMGVSSVRADWGCKLNSDGSVYDYDSDNGYFQKTIEEAEKHGMDILAILGVSLSGSGSNGGFNIDSDALSSYQSYCRELAEKLAGKVERFELGNEDNYTKRRANASDLGVNRIVLSNSRTLVDTSYVYVYTGENYNSPTKYALSDVSCTITEKTNSSGSVYASLCVTENATGTTLLDDVAAYVFDTGENYYKILSAGFDGIKEGNPNAIVATSGSQVVYQDPEGTMNRNQREFAKGILAAAQSNNDYCFDAYATHPYHPAQAPEILDIYIQQTKWFNQGNILKDLLSEYSAPQSTQRWATEFGYSVGDSSEDSSSAKKISAWIVRTFLANEIYDCYDRMYLYDVIDDGLDATNGEHNFGTVCCYKNRSRYDVSAYAAKPQYLALAQYNKMTADAEFVNNTTSGTIYTSQFNKNNGSVYVVWDTANAGSEVTVSGRGSYVNVYDMYGNVINSAKNVDSINVVAGEEPVYVEFCEPTTGITISDTTGNVTIVNNTDTAISPVAMVLVTESDGTMKSLYTYKEYFVNGEKVSQIEPGQCATVTVNTDYDGYGVKVMLWSSLDNMVPMCKQQLK